MLLLWQCRPTALVTRKKGDSGSSTHGLRTINPCCSPPKHKDPPQHLTHPSPPNHISSLLYLLLFSMQQHNEKTFPIKLVAAPKMSKSTSHKNYNFPCKCNLIIFPQEMKKGRETWNSQVHFIDTEVILHWLVPIFVVMLRYQHLLAHLAHAPKQRASVRKQRYSCENIVRLFMNAAVQDRLNQHLLYHQRRVTHAGV